MKIFRTEKANQDLLQIYSYLAEHNRTVADAFVRDIDSKFTNLSRFPFIGRERSSLVPGIRSIVVGTHLVFYAVERDRVVILRVIDGRRDVDEEFKR